MRIQGSPPRPPKPPRARPRFSPFVPFSEWERLYDWHQWFAWHPVKTTANTWVWLETIERKRIVFEGFLYRG